MKNLTAKEILDSPAEFDHVLEVRSIGPMICLVMELDSPLRMETSTSTQGEEQALLNEVTSNAKWAELRDLFDQLRCEDEGIPTADLWRRQDEHSDRLQRGRRIETCRVSTT